MSRKAVKFIIFLALVGFGVGLSLYLDFRQYLNPQDARELISSYGTLAPLAFIVLKALLGAFFLPGIPFNIGAGAVFGPLAGTIYVLIGDLFGATAAFLIAHYLARDYVHHLLKTKFKKIHSYIQKTEKRGFWITLFLRIAQIFPYNLSNLALGISKVSFRDFVLGTLIGSAPGVYLYASLGDALLEPEFETIGILIGFITILWLFGLGLREHLKHREKESAIIKSNQDLRKQK